MRTPRVRPALPRHGEVVHARHRAKGSRQRRGLTGWGRPRPTWVKRGGEAARAVVAGGALVTLDDLLAVFAAYGSTCPIPASSRWCSPPGWRTTCQETPSCSSWWARLRRARPRSSSSPAADFTAHAPSPSDLSLAGLLTVDGRDDGDHPLTAGRALLRDLGAFGVILAPELSTLIAESRREGLQGLRGAA